MLSVTLPSPSVFHSQEEDHVAVILALAFVVVLGYVIAFIISSLLLSIALYKRHKHYNEKPFEPVLKDNFLWRIISSPLIWGAFLFSAPLHMSFGDSLDRRDFINYDTVNNSLFIIFNIIFLALIIAFFIGLFTLHSKLNKLETLS